MLNTKQTKTSQYYIPLTSFEALNMHYLWSGKFIAPSSEWIHMSRELGEYELFLVLEGTLYISDNLHNYTVNAGEYLIMQPTNQQYGVKPSYTSFYWLHFTASPTYITNQVSSIDAKNSTVISNHGVIHNIERITVLLSQLQETDRRYHNPYTCDLLAFSLLLELYNQQHKPPVNSLSHKNQLYQDILDYVSWNRLGVIRITELAQYFGYHEKYISTFFKEMSGIPLKQYLIQEKMNYAKAELISSSISINQLAYNLGFSDSHNFSNAFKKVIGMSPIQYRNNYRQIRKRS